MERSMGLRAQPSRVDFAVIEAIGDKGEVVSLGQIVVPKALSRPFQLNHLRTTIIDVLDEFQVAVAGIRLTEANAVNRSTDRIQLEAVIQEALAGSRLRGLFAGRLTSIAARLDGYTATSLKEAIASSTPFPLVDGWQTLTLERREAVLVALAAAEDL